VKSESVSIGGQTQKILKRVSILSVDDATSAALANSIFSSHNHSFTVAGQVEYGSIKTDPMEQVGRMNMISDSCTSNPGVGCLAVLIFMKRAIYFQMIEDSSGTTFILLVFGLSIILFGCELANYLCPDPRRKLNSEKAKEEADKSNADKKKYIEPESPGNFEEDSDGRLSFRTMSRVITSVSTESLEDTILTHFREADVP